MTKNTIKNMEENLLYHSDLVSYSLIEAKSILHCKWNASNNVNYDELQADIALLCKLICEKQPRAVLDDSLEVNYAIPPNIQEEIAKLLDTALITGNTKKYALINPRDFIAELSNEQTFSEIDTLQQNAASWVQQSFETEAEALQWLES